eukprot:596245-Amphidinium_carterae.2
MDLVHREQPPSPLQEMLTRLTPYIALTQVDDVPTRLMQIRSNHLENNNSECYRPHDINSCRLGFLRKASGA